MKRLALCLMLLAWPVSAEPLPPEAAQEKKAVPVPVAQAQNVAEPTPAATPEQRTAQSVVQAKLVTPLSEKESTRSRFSRVLLPATVMRVRVIDPQPQKDTQGGAYLTFAVDSCRAFNRKADCWQQAAITGCVYPTSGQVFVQRGKQYFPAEIMLGKKAESAVNVCQATPSGTT